MPCILQVVASLQGGGGRHAVTLAKGLLERGCTIGLIAPNDDPVLAEHLKAMGVVWRVLPLDRRPSQSLIRSFRRFVRDFRPDIIHLHGHRAGLLGRLLMPVRNFSKTQLVYTYHGYHPAHYTTPWNRALGNTIERLFYPTTDACIAVSSDTAESAAFALGIDKGALDVIPNGIDLQGPVTETERHRARQILRTCFPFNAVDRECFLIGTIARLQWQKGLVHLLHAWCEFQKRRNAFPLIYSNYRLVIAGDGPDRATLEAFAAHYDLSETVGFLGAVESGRSVLAGLDLFVLPSLWEGLPLTILEAWDAGIPVAATDVEGTRCLIRHDLNGFLCAPDSQAITSALSLLIGDRTRRERYTEYGFRDVQDYSAEKMVDHTMNIYRRCMKSSNN